MSEIDRHFERRRVSWEITNPTEIVKEALKSQKFTINVAGNQTQWYLSIRKEPDEDSKQDFLALFLNITETEKRNFQIRFTAYVKKTDGSLGGVRTFVEDSKKFTGVGWPKFISNENVHNKETTFLVSGSLKIECVLELITNAKINVFSPTKQTDNLEKLINNEKHANFVFNCSDNKKIHVNKCIISVQCPAFEAMLDANMNETITGEAKIEDVDSDTMLELVRFIYCGRVENIEDIHETLIVAANKYGIEDLKKLCVSSLTGKLSSGNVFDVIKIADLVGEKHLKENCIDYIKCHNGHLNREDLLKKLGNEFLLEVFDSTWNEPNHISLKDSEPAPVV